MAQVPDKYRGTKEYALGYAMLILAARSRGMITYRGIARSSGLPDQEDQMGKEVGLLLGEISEDEVKRGRPMLSAIAVLKSDGRPSDSFFEFAERLGKPKCNSEAEREKFWQKEVTQLYDFWDI